MCVLLLGADQEPSVLKTNVRTIVAPQEHGSEAELGTASQVGESGGCRGQQALTASKHLPPPTAGPRRLGSRVVCCRCVNDVFADFGICVSFICKYEHDSGAMRGTNPDKNSFSQARDDPECTVPQMSQKVVQSDHKKMQKQNRFHTGCSPSMGFTWIHLRLDYFWVRASVSINDSISSLLLLGPIWIHRKMWACVRGRVKLGAGASGEEVCGDRGFCACQHACVCVRARERERERRGGRWSCIPNQLLPSSR